MDRTELQKQLAEYAQKIKSGVASTADHSAIKNVIRETYDAGNLDKETMSDLGKAATHNFKNRFAAKDLANVPSRIIEKGGSVGKLDTSYKPEIGGVFKSAKDAGKKMRSFGPLLGMLGAGAAAMGVGNKAMAGDLGGAGLDAADIATDYLPGVGQLKSAVRPTELGAEPTDPVSMKGSLFEEDYNTLSTKINNSNINPKMLPPSSEKPIDATEEPKQRAKYSDLKKMFGRK